MLNYESSSGCSQSNSDSEEVSATYHYDLDQEALLAPSQRTSRVVSQYVTQLANERAIIKDKKKRKGSGSDDDKILNYSLKGIRVPIKMRKDAEGVPIKGEEDIVQLATECPFPPTSVESLVVDRLITTLWDEEEVITASKEALDLLKQHEKLQKAQRKAEKAARRERRREKSKLSKGKSAKSNDLPILRSVCGPLLLEDEDLSLSLSHSFPSPPQSISNSPHLRPPPSTPPEHAALPYILSTPHLPGFHPYTDPQLFTQYQAERTLDPIAFDQTTAKIKKYLLDAKIERGGAPKLEDGEYSVDVASREDVRKAAVMRRRRVFDMDRMLVREIDGPKLPDPLVKEPDQLAKAQRAQQLSCSSSAPLSPPLPDTSTIPSPFDFPSHVTKYITNGSMRHQNCRKDVQDETGTHTTLNTWIEITQEVFTPCAGSLGIEDVVKARDGRRRDKAEARERKERERARAKKKEERGKGKEKGLGTDTNDSESNSNEDSRAKRAPTEAENLLSTIAQIPELKDGGNEPPGLGLAKLVENVKKLMDGAAMVGRLLVQEGAAKEA